MMMQLSLWCKDKTTAMVTSYRLTRSKNKTHRTTIIDLVARTQPMPMVVKFKKISQLLHHSVPRQLQDRITREAQSTASLWL